MKTHIKLDISTSFKNACEMFNILEQYVLQSFINKISLYAHVARRTTFDHLASSVFGQYINTHPADRKEKDEIKRAIGEKYIKQLFFIILSRLHLTKKENLYITLLQKWYEEYSQLQQFSTEVQINESYTLSLSKDMVMLCDICKCPAEEILQFFVNQVHLPTAEQMEDGNKYSLATCFFLECAGQD